MKEYEADILLTTGERKTLVVFANSPNAAILRFGCIIPEGAVVISCRQIIGRGTQESSIERREQP